MILAKLQSKGVFVMAENRPLNNIVRAWVRKLIGKPGGHTPPDRQFDAGRIHFDYDCDLPFLAVANRAWRTHSDLLLRDVAIAACNSRFSSGDTRAWTRMPRRLAFGTFGLPIFVLIKTLCITIIIVDRIYILSYV
jgi:hypothetical protein